MTRRSRLRRRIFFLALLPSAIGALVILAGFCYLQSHQVKLLEQQKFALTDNLIALYLDDLERPERFRQLSRSLLAVDPVRRVMLYSADRGQLAAAGLPDTHGLVEVEEHLRAPSHRWRDDTSYYSATQVRTADEPLWLVVEMDRSPFSVMRHKIFITLLLMSAVLILTMLYFGKRLLHAVIRPLERLNTGIEGFLNGYSEIPTDIDDDSEFQDLANAIAALAGRQRVELDGIQQHLEEQTQDLRESLETVEIQNIELDMARKSALQASRAKSEFLANASHELRTPLNGVLGFANLLLKTELSNQQTDYVTTIEQSAQGLLTIINDILDISRLETGDLILEYKPVPIYQIIEDVLKMHAPSAHEKKLRLVTLMDPHVPENLLGDPLRLKQVITNLISNAIKFSDKGNIAIRVNFLGETDNQVHLKISISDDGIGLTPEQQDGLFETFTQVDMADNRLRGGTGLGLAIARGLVQRMHGDIGVESEVGRGSTFWFTARLGVNSRGETQPTQAPALGGVHVVICDSNEVGRAEITHLLNNWGASYTEANDFDSVSDAVESQQSHGPVHIVILDAQQPDSRFDQNKLHDCVEKLNNQFHLPVIILALPNQCRTLQPLLEKLQAFALPRPVSHHQLYRTVCAQLGVNAASVESPENLLPQTSNGRRPRILAVDDNAANLRLVTELLRSIGTYVETAPSGEAALAMCEHDEFDLILMDIQMPGLDGLETTRRLRQAESPGKRTPIVALTAHAVNEQKTRLLLAGMDDYLSKPVNDLDLRHVVERWVTKRETRSTPVARHGVGAPEHSIDTPTTFDLTLALERANGNPALARDMFIMLLESLESTSAEIRKSRSNGDMDQLQEVVHKLYGGCCYCGVPELCRQAERLQSLLQQGNPEADVNEAADALLQAIVKLQDWAGEHDVDALFSDS